MRRFPSRSSVTSTPTLSRLWATFNNCSNPPFGTIGGATLVISGTGSAGMEAAVANFVDAGAKLAVFANGYFSDRLTEMAKRNGANVVRFEKNWGEIYTDDEARDFIGREKPKVVVAADECRPAFQRCIEQNRSVLQLMAMYFHAHARRRLSINRVIDGVALSPRELECLEWAAQGKSAWEIGRLLNISRRTAAFHLDNAKTKFGVRSICQAVAKLAASKATTE